MFVRHAAALVCALIAFAALAAPSAQARPPKKNPCAQKVGPAKKLCKVKARYKAKCSGAKAGSRKCVKLYLKAFCTTKKAKKSFRCKSAQREVGKQPDGGKGGSGGGGSTEEPQTAPAVCADGTAPTSDGFEAKCGDGQEPTCAPGFLLDYDDQDRPFCFEATDEDLQFEYVCADGSAPHFNAAGVPSCDNGQPAVDADFLFDYYCDSDDEDAEPMLAPDGTVVCSDGSPAIYDDGSDDGGDGEGDAEDAESPFVIVTRLS